MATPDQGWESYLKEIQRHGLPTPPDAPTSAGAAATATDSGHAAATFGSVPSGIAASANVSVPTALAAANVPSVVTELPTPTGSLAGMSTAATSSVVSDSQGSLFLSGSQSLASFGWHIVPSAANEYGPGLGADEFKIDLAGDFLQDWYFV